MQTGFKHGVAAMTKMAAPVMAGITARGVIAIFARVAVESW